MHVAIVMDGSGRWALARGATRPAGHARGVGRVREIVTSAPAFGIDVLTLYAFSADNWKRPPAEVSGLMRLFERYLHMEGRELQRAGVRLTVIGRRDRIPPALRRRMDAVEHTTLHGSRLWLRLAIDYSGREALRCAAEAAWALPVWSREAFDCRVGSGRGEPSDTPDVDLLVRTGGEQRLSDFLLWECAYAEFWFTKTRWPAFGVPELGAAVDAFRARRRRFGGLVAEKTQTKKPQITQISQIRSSSRA
jgi:undecaprenyl diphosphate synthase